MCLLTNFPMLEETTFHLTAEVGDTSCLASILGLCNHKEGAQPSMIKTTEKLYKFLQKVF